MVLEFLRNRDAAVRQHFADRVKSDEDLSASLMENERQVRLAKEKNDENVNLRRVLELATNSMKSGRKDGAMADILETFGDKDPRDFAGFRDDPGGFGASLGLDRDRARELVARYEVETAPIYKARRLGNALIRPLADEGPAARIGMVAGITAGSAMALTPAAQGLIALTQNMQQANESAAARQEPLGQGGQG